MYKSSAIVIGIQCIQALLVLSDMGGRPTRGLSMLRMGKRNLGYIRSLPPLVPPSYDLPEDDINERQLMGAPRMGKDIEDYDFPRYPSSRHINPLPRLGNLEEYINEIKRELSSNDINLRPSYDTFSHNTGYLGRQKRSTDNTDLTEETAALPNEEANKEKRALPRFGMREIENEVRPVPRLGLYDRDIPFPRLGLYERAFPRLGVREEEERSRPMPRLGARDMLNEVEAEERALPRYGLRDLEDEKRAMSMLRMGKREEETPNEEKRKMSMLRMGKRKMSMLRMGKRGGMSMLRMGRSQPEDTTNEKRAMSMLRMGRSSPDNTDSSYTDQEKRVMSMLRMGKRGSMSMLRMGRSNTDSDKRAMSMLRMGRGMSMLRMGRSSPDMTEQNEIASPNEQQKRAMRIGRGMSMLRMGKRESGKEEMNITGDKRAMSMLRMGKRDVLKSDTVNAHES